MTLLKPDVTLVLAMSADGKIADRDRRAARFSSPQDLAHLETQVAQADAVLFGAGTLRAYQTCLSVRCPSLLAQRRARGQPPQPIQIVCSGSGQLEARWRFFRQAVPRWLLTTPAGAQAWQPGGAAFERVLPWLSTTTDWRRILTALGQLQIRRLVLLGGGTLVAAWVEQDCIDEWYLTVCPVLLGGQSAPTPIDGPGFPAAQAVPLQLVDVHPLGHEVVLHYRRCHPQGD